LSLQTSRDIFLNKADQPVGVFERRYYETLRRHALAPAIGNLALKAANNEELEGMERRQYEEITSGLAEALPGVVKTEYPFEFKNGKLVASDGESIEELLENGLKDAIRMAEVDNFYAGYLPYRARHELDELHEQQKMATEDTGFNTIVAFSPYTEELNSPETQNKITRGGQKPYWQRGMLRISHWDGEQLHMFTRSIDKSSVDLFRRVADKHFDYQFNAHNSTEMLGERLHLNVEDESWRTLADSVVATADKILGERLGGVWHQGRTKQEAKDLQVFVESEAQVIGSLLQIGRELAGQHARFESYKKAFDHEMYNHIALLEKRLELGATEKIVDVRAASGGAGSMARAEGRSYDMCGNVIGAGNSVSNAAAETGFESLTRLANKKVECPECKAKVIIPTEDLKAGRLYCEECDYGVDVCTGQKFSRGHKGGYKNQAEPNVFEVISMDLAKYKQEEQQKELARKQAEEQQKLTA
jgi:hypothetical protein